MKVGVIAILFSLLAVSCGKEPNPQNSKGKGVPPAVPVATPEWSQPHFMVDGDSFLNGGSQWQMLPEQTRPERLEERFMREIKMEKMEVEPYV